MNTDLIKQGNILESDQLDIEYRQRRKDMLEQTIDKSTQVPDGWSPKRTFKKKVRISKIKDISMRLQDKVWCLFYDIGIRKISSRKFVLLLKKRGESEKTKEIDVLAIDEDIVFVVECKTREKHGKKSLKKDIAEFAKNMNDVRNSVKSIFDNRNLKFVFVFATENIEWDPNDRLDAEGDNILIWDEYDIMALQELANLAGEGAKYQMYNRIFFGKKIKNFEVKVPALKSKMGGHTYYSFVLSPEHLLKIGFVHQRAGQCSFLELSNSYQRMIKRSRIRRIERFIQEKGFFPTNVIVNFSHNLDDDPLGSRKHLSQLRKEAKPVVVKLPPYYGSAWIIDGQHRLYGFADIKEKSTETIPVIAFVQESSQMQAKAFVDINKNQKAIESDLLWDLYEDLYPGTELHAISMIAKALNSKNESPFYGHICIPKEQNKGNITLTTVCTGIKQQKLVSKDKGCLFKDSYEKTIDYAAERISCFFDVIRENMKDEWLEGDKHYVRTNAGFVVLIGILHDLVDCTLSVEEIKNIKKFRKSVYKFLEPLLIHFWDKPEKISEYRGAGGAGQKSRQVRAELTKLIRDSIRGFRSTWLEKYIEAAEEKDAFAKRKQGAKYYLDRDESEVLEFKGSMLLNVKRYLMGDGKWAENENILCEGVLKTIVAFLNCKGGEVLIGALEKNRFEKASDEKISDYPVHKNWIVFGINDEYKKDGWDGYQQRLYSFIERRIGGDVIDADLIGIEKLSYQDKDLCLVKVGPAESQQYVENKKFYIRRGNKTVQLEGREIQRYWSKRRL